MHRNIIKQLTKWKNKNTDKPTVLQGVKHIGKTFLVVRFGKNHFPACHYIDCEKHFDIIQGIFNGGAVSIAEFLKCLSHFFKKGITPNRDLLILDEILFLNDGLNILIFLRKYLPKLKVIATTSQLGKFDQGDAFCNLLTVRPINFEDFLYAIGEINRAQFLAKLSQTPESIDNIPSSHILTYLFKEYLITGGYPISISKFIEHRKDPLRAYKEVRNIQKKLVENYTIDFLDAPDPLNTKHINRVFNAIPHQLAKHSHTKKFIFSNIINKGSRGFRDLAPLIQWLKSTGLVLQVHQLRAPNMPKLKCRDQVNFKLYLSDVGLLGAMSNITPKQIIDLDDHTFTGFLLENYLLQELNTQGFDEVDTWISRSAEINFVASSLGYILFPIQLNSGVNKKDKCLLSYKYHNAPLLALRFGGSAIQIDSESEMCHYPLFLASRVLHDLSYTPRQYLNSIPKISI